MCTRTVIGVEVSLVSEKGGKLGDVCYMPSICKRVWSLGSTPFTRRPEARAKGEIKNEGVRQMARAININIFKFSFGATPNCVLNILNHNLCVLFNTREIV